MAFACFVVGLFLMVTLMKTRQTSAEAENLTDAEFAQLAKDLRHIAGLGIFPTGPGERDAGALINAYLPLNTMDASPADEVAWWSDPADRGAVDETWLATSGELLEGDFALLSELLDYDYWEASSSGAYGRYVQAQAMPVGFSTPLPSYLPLLTLAKLRLGDGLRGGDMLPALEEVRHLAKLVYSDETLVGAMVGVQMLLHEGEAYRLAVSEGLLSEGDWEAVSEEDVIAMRKAIYGVTFTLRGGAGTDGYALLGELGVPVFGLCAAAAETSMDVTIRRAMLQDPVPLEPDFSHLDAMIRSAIGHESCRLPAVKKALGEGYDRERVLAEMFPEESGARGLLVPYVRSWIYLTLTEVLRLGNPYRGD